MGEHRVLRLRAPSGSGACRGFQLYATAAPPQPSALPCHRRHALQSWMALRGAQGCCCWPPPTAPMCWMPHSCGRAACHARCAALVWGPSSERCCSEEARPDGPLCFPCDLLLPAAAWSREWGKQPSTRPAPPCGGRPSPSCLPPTQVVVPLPGEEARAAILGVHLRKVPLASQHERELACEAVAKITAGEGDGGL